jgi:hypothetical protein
LAKYDAASYAGIRKGAEMIGSDTRFVGSMES